LHFPVTWQNGQRLQCPALVLLTIGFRWCGFHQVPKTPGHHHTASLQAAITLLASTQYLGNITTLRGLFAKKEFHESINDLSFFLANSTSQGCRLAFSGAMFNRL